MCNQRTTNANNFHSLFSKFSDKSTNLFIFIKKKKKRRKRVEINNCVIYAQVKVSMWVL